ncbi:MAG TPA: penicillin-binding transpeptidase domain-containing protein, partial [Beijerinckiaceae bacterium]|nr:penicillin-binding transpeptidase domain-containing protein [Beijerinckiaceae bacterium]
MSTPAAPEDPAPLPSRLGRALVSVRELFTLRVDRSMGRVGLVAVAFTILFGVIAGRLVWLALHPEAAAAARRGAQAIAAARPDIIDKDEAVELLTAVLPDVNARELRERLGTRKGFIWVKREITPRQQAEVHRLGIPGVGFLPEHKRVYPNGLAAAHVLGFANIDNVGIAGIEKYIDGQGLQDLAGAGMRITSEDLKPVQLSIDLRVQHAVRDELAKGVAKFKAKAGAALVMDVNTSEVVALVSLPDFDPNNPVDALEKDRINRINVGVFEMGSTFKALTTAMALDSGKFTINSGLD